MTLKPVFISIIALLLIAAGTIDHPTKGKIKTIKRIWWSDTLVCDYDAQGRISDQHAGRIYKTIYDYRHNTIMESNNSGRKVTMFLNSRGLVDSLIDIDPARISTSTPGPDGQDNMMSNFGPRRDFLYSGNHVLSLGEMATVVVHSIITVSKKFKYDAEGYIKEEKGYGDGKLLVLSTSEIQNGNLISYKVKYLVGDTVIRFNAKKNKNDTAVFTQGDFIVKNTFDPTKANTLATNDFFGKCSRNLIARSTHYESLSPTPDDSTITTFQYSFDKESRVSTLIQSVKSTDPPEANHDKEMADTCRITYY